MPDNNLKVDEETLITQIADIKRAVNYYIEFSKNPFTEEIEALGKMNTDFVAKFKVMIENLDDNNIELIRKLEIIAENTEKILENFQEVDENAVNSMGCKKEA